MAARESNDTHNGSKKRRQPLEEPDDQMRGRRSRSSSTEDDFDMFQEYEEDYENGGFGSWSFRTSYGFPNFRKRRKRQTRGS